MSYHNPIAPIGLIISAIIILILFNAIKLFDTTPDYLERIYVDNGDTFFISLVKPSTEDYEWDIEYNKNYARLIEEKSIKPMSSAIGGFKSRKVYQFQSLDHGIIYIILPMNVPIVRRVCDIVYLLVVI